MVYACRILVVVLEALRWLKLCTFHARLFINYTNEISTEL